LISPNNLSVREYNSFNYYGFSTTMKISREKEEWDWMRMDVFQRQKAKKVNKINEEGGRFVEWEWVYWFNIFTRHSRKSFDQNSLRFVIRMRHHFLGRAWTIGRLQDKMKVTTFSVSCLSLLMKRIKHEQTKVKYILCVAETG